MRRSISIWAGTVLVMLAMLAPFGVNEYYQSFLLQVFLVIALAQAWNLISGMTGYVSFGHAAFFGVGAYAGALLLTWGFPWWAAILHGAGIAALLAVPLGFLPSLDVKYFTMFGLALAATLLVAWVHRSRFGLELRAIREDEEAAEMVGVNTTRNKVTAFVLSALIPGAVGAVYAMYTSYINPASAFDHARNIEMIVVVLFGGSGTVWGPIIGAATVMVLREMLWAQFPAAHLAALGVLLLIVVLYLPGGLISIVRERQQSRPDARPGESP
jgi:branched-chain amino acid transport system permease protein